MNSVRKESNGAMTQPLRMECYQTQINVGESVGMTIEEIGPTILEIGNYPTLDKRPAHHASDISLFLRG